MTEHVYFVKFGDAIKIGVSANAEGRIDGFTTANAHHPEILGVTEGDVRVERAIHMLLRDHRIRGEWFRDCPEVRDVIGRMAKPMPRRPKADHARRARQRATATDLMRKAKGWIGKGATAWLASAVNCDVSTAERYFAGTRAPSAENLLALLRSSIGPRLLEEATRTLSPEEFERFWKAMGEAALRAWTRGNNEAW